MPPDVFLHSLTVDISDARQYLKQDFSKVEIIKIWHIRIWVIRSGELCWEDDHVGDNAVIVRDSPRRWVSNNHIARVFGLVETPAHCPVDNLI